jgi:hypothetical protein
MEFDLDILIDYVKDIMNNEPKFKLYSILQKIKKYYILREQ